MATAAAAAAAATAAAAAAEIDVSLESAPLDVAALFGAFLSRADGGAGALASFVGTTRADAGVSLLEYEAYAPMALTELRRACAAAQARSGGALRRVWLRHRVGAVRIGEASLALLVSSAHRAPALAAVAAILEDLKAHAPIWKRDVPAAAASVTVEAGAGAAADGGGGAARGGAGVGHLLWRANAECAWGRAEQPSVAAAAEPPAEAAAAAAAAAAPPPQPTDTTAFRIVEGAEWAAALAAGEYAGSPLDARDGFMHLSCRAAVRETARRYYGSANGPLLLLEVDLAHGCFAARGVRLQWDFVASRGEHFPHLYPPRLPAVAVRAVHELRAAPQPGSAADAPLLPFAFPEGT